MKIGHAGILLLIAVATSCDGVGTRSGGSGVGGPMPYQISDVACILKPGVSELIVTQRFGAPLHISDVSDSPSGKWLIYHSLSSTADLRTSNDMIGFQVLIRSNVVVSWDPVRTHYDKFD